MRAREFAQDANIDANGPLPNGVAWLSQLLRLAEADDIPDAPNGYAIALAKENRR